MSNTTKVKVTASPASVREWASEQGIKVGTRGKFSRDLIRAFNKAHAVKYSPGNHVAAVKHTAKPDKGRAKTLTINVAQVRAAAAEAGVPVGDRGRVSKAIKDAYVLGTLDALAE